jgi:hypothetical protein
MTGGPGVSTNSRWLTLFDRRSSHMRVLLLRASAGATVARKCRVQTMLSTLHTAPIHCADETTPATVRRFLTAADAAQYRDDRTAAELYIEMVYSLLSSRDELHWQPHDIV